MGLDLNTLSDVGSAWIIQGAPDYASIWEAGLQREPMGIGDIAAVRVKHSSAWCNPLSSLG
eukprot:14423846-Heterocapsa_arctica.AAC.1